MSVADSSGAVARRKVQFDLTINLGHVLTATAFLLSTVAGWVTLDARVTSAEKEAKRIEAQGKENIARVESTLLDRIKTNETAAGKFEFNYREDMRDVKTLLTRIEDKLDRKADKPAR